MTTKIVHGAMGLGFAALFAAGPVFAADGFRLRYPLSGTFANELTSPLDKPGWFGGLVLTAIDIDKVTDDTGNARQQLVSGAFATPAPIAGSVRTASYAGTVHVDVTQKQTLANLVMGYAFPQSFGAGRFVLALNVPYSPHDSRQLAVTGTTPTLTPLAPALPAVAAGIAQSAVQSGFDTAYQSNLAAASTAGTGSAQGWGDAELSAAWLYQRERLRVSTAVTLVIPTGQYNAASAVNVGYGNFYTLRPGVSVSYAINESVIVGARAVLGMNTRNRDNNVRSGNYAALDLAAAFRTPIGTFGPHMVHVQQYQDDNGGAFGGNRYRTTAAGAFFSMPIASLGANLGVTYMKIVDARNAQSGTVLQARVAKAF